MELKIKTYRVYWAKGETDIVKCDWFTGKTRKAAEKAARAKLGQKIIIDSITEEGYCSSLINSNID